MNVKPINNLYKSPVLKHGFKFASENSALFLAGTSLALSAFVRPVVTMHTPNTKKEDRKISTAKSIASALLDFGFMAAVTLPFSKGVSKIDAKPEKYLNQKTIQNLSEGYNNLKDSKAYELSKDLFKLGLGFLCAFPKAIMNNAIIPPIFSKMDEDKRELTFKGKLEESIASIINNKKTQKIVKKFQNTNFKTHLIALKDMASTTAFIALTNKNDELSQRNKKVLSYNSAISTGLCLLGGYSLDKILDKPTQKFSDKFIKLNPELDNPQIYKNGIQIAKKALAFGLIYYAAIPLISTFISSRLADNSPQDKNNI